VGKKTQNFRFSTLANDNMGEDFEEKKTNADFPIRPFNKEFSSFAKLFLFFEKTVEIVSP